MNSFWKFLIKICCFLVLFSGLDYLLSRVALTGLEHYFGLDQPADIVCIGHSHTVLGIDKSILEKRTGKRVAVIAREGADISDRAVMLAQYFNRFPESHPLVLYDVNPRIFNATGLSENSYTFFYPFLNESVVSDYIQQCRPGFQGNLLRRILCLPRYNDKTIRFSLRGWFGVWDNLKTNRITEEDIHRVIQSGIFSDIRPDSACIAILDRTLARCIQQGCTVVLLNIPSIDVIQADTSRKNQVLRRFQQADASSRQIIYFDYNPAFSNRYEFFSDPIHLNREGQRVFTEQLAKDLDSVYFGPAVYR